MPREWPPSSSLQRRIGAMHHLWQAAVSDLTVEQVNHHERRGVLPLTFSLLHYVRGEDTNISTLILKEPALWESGGWREKVGSTVDAAPRGTPMEVSEGIRFADMDAWRAYQTLVFERTESILAGGSIDWEQELFRGGFPPAMQGSFLWHMLGAEGRPLLIDAIEAFIYQHGIRHLGEIEHARALVGLGGTS